MVFMRHRCLIISVNREKLLWLYFDVCLVWERHSLIVTTSEN